MAREVTALSLLDALSETGFQSSVIATYCCYFPFYEEVLLRRLLDRGCTNNILMVDARLCAQAFADEYNRPRRAGRDYTLLPVEVDGAFHPKLVVTLGKSKGTLFVGSHNTTIAGFGLNDEITNEFRISGSGARRGAVPIRAALDYLQRFVPKGLADVAHVFAAARRNIPWLEGPMPLESDDRRFMGTTGRDADLWSRVRPLVPKRPSLAFVCGPFFDKNLKFLQQLVDDIKPRRLVVGIDPESVQIDPHAVSRFRGAEFVNVAGLPRVPNRREVGARYLHAKILWFSGTDRELLVTGSANPSKAAFLSARSRRNAEAIVVDRRAGAATALGIDGLASAPSLHEKDWTQVAERQATQRKGERDAGGTVILAVPSDDCFELERPLARRVTLNALDADGTFLGRTTTRQSDLAVVEATPEIRDEAHTLCRSGSSKKPVVILIHRPNEVAKHVGGDRQRELRRALGALEENPAQLDMLLKLTEKVIFESNDVVHNELPVPAKTRTGDPKAENPGPRSFAVNATGRPGARKKKRLASGDVLVLLDALMYRLGQGLRGPAVLRPPTEEVMPVPEDDSGDAEPPPPPPPYEILAKTCRAKVRKLIQRMIKQLEPARSAGACRAVVQLAAVLSVVHTLRIMEQRSEWRSKHLRLVDQDDELPLFEAGTLAIAWGGSALGPRAISESGGEPFEELSLTIGLLAWLAWEVNIDARAAVERTSGLHIEEEEPPWHEIQLFAAIAARLSGDEGAQETLTSAVTSTARKGADVPSWLKTHLRVAERLAHVISEPENVAKMVRPPIPGDLVILGPAYDPRVRIALEVGPSRGSDKVTVLDPDDDDGKRLFLANRVGYVPLFEQEPTSKDVVGL